MKKMRNIIKQAMTELARRRSAKLTPERRKEIAIAAGKKSWEGMNEEERSAEMKRRAKVRERNRTAKAKKGAK